MFKDVESQDLEPVSVEEKMMIFVGRQILGDRVGQAELGLPIHFRGLKQKSENSEADPDAQLKMLRKTMKIVEYDRDVYYEGEPLIFVCIGAKYFYQDMVAHFMLNWKDKSSTQLNPPKSNGFLSASKFLFLSNGAEIFGRVSANMVNVFSDSIKATKGMKSVECWMPAEGRSKWDKLTKGLTILPSVAPKWREPEVETVYLNVGDQTSVVTCTLIEAVPPPKIWMLMNGKKQNMNHSFNQSSEEIHLRAAEQGKNLVNLTLTLSDLVNESQTVVECVAENINSTTKRVIHVFVKGIFELLFILKLQIYV